MAKPYSVVARTSVIALALGVVGLFVAWREGHLPSASAHHSAEELEAFRGGGSTALAFGQNTYFMASGNCGILGFARRLTTKSNPSGAVPPPPPPLPLPLPLPFPLPLP